MAHPETDRAHANPNAGPLWWWYVAWSLQGTGVLLVERAAIADDWLRFGVIGAVAAIPLVGLYVALRARAR